MKTSGLAALLPGLLLAACSSSDEPQLSTIPKVESLDHYVPVEDAILTAQKYVAGIHPATRGVSLTPLKVEMLGNTKTRSAQANDEGLWGYYVINFANEEGFAIVSADDRNQPIYAFSDEGNLSLSDTINNKGLQLYLESLPTSAVDIQDIGGWTGLNPTPDIMTYREVAPLLDATVRTWNQRSPFNKYCIDPNDSSIHYVVGCVPLATGMLMSFYEWPERYGDYSFDWEEMKASHQCDMNARLLQILGDRDNLQAKYGVSATSAYFSRIIPTFKNMGYENMKYTGFSEEKAVEIIKSRKPIEISGSSNLGGHAWIMDGLYTTRITNASLQNPTPSYTYYYFLHCVWGWGGKNNGYYSFPEKVSSSAPEYTEPDETKDVLYGSPWTATGIYYDPIPRK